MIHKTKKFERRKKYKIKYSQTEIEHDRRIINLYTLSKELNNINKSKVECKEVKEENKSEIKKRG